MCIYKYKYSYMYMYIWLAFKNIKRLLLTNYFQQVTWSIALWQDFVKKLTSPGSNSCSQQLLLLLSLLFNFFSVFISNDIVLLLCSFSADPTVLAISAATGPVDFRYSILTFVFNFLFYLYLLY